MTSAVAEAPVVEAESTPVTVQSMRLHVGRLVGCSSDRVRFTTLWEDSAGLRARVRLTEMRNNAEGFSKEYVTSNHFCHFQGGVLISANPPLPKREQAA